MNILKNCPLFENIDDEQSIRTDVYTRWDLAAREKDLKLFIKVPVSCKSSITILEGDYRTFNDNKYTPENGSWKYVNNRCVLNFNHADNIDLNSYEFKPISQLQLLAFNNGESYPFADRLLEYLSGSAITPRDDIPDNIKRVQRVMEQNGQYFKIEGLWENKMQNILYDYVMNSGPVKLTTICTDSANYGKVLGKDISADQYVGPTAQVLKDSHEGYHKTLGHSNKSMLFDVLGYADKDTEKWYASWKKDNNKAVVGTSLQSVDIYDGLYDI